MSAVVGVLVAWMPSIELDWEQSGFGKLGVALVAVNFGLIVCMVLFRPNKRIDLFEPLYFMAFLFFMVFVARPLQIILQYDTRVYALPNNPLLIQEVLGLSLIHI